VFSADREFLARPSCRLEPLDPERPVTKPVNFRVSDWIQLPPCHDLNGNCAKRHVTAHPDFLDPRTALKEWAFPPSFLRVTTGVGLRHSFRTLGLGYIVDMDKLSPVGRFLPLPGRLGLEAFYWHQDLDDADGGSCLAECKRSSAVGWGLRYDTFVSNLFGLYGTARVYTAPFSDLWASFGPFVEAPIGKHTNVSVEGGVAFRPTESPRFEFRINFGLWKPKTRQIGMRAGNDRGR